MCCTFTGFHSSDGGFINLKLLEPCDFKTNSVFILKSKENIKISGLEFTEGSWRVLRDTTIHR